MSECAQLRLFIPNVHVTVSCTCLYFLTLQNECSVASAGYMIIRIGPGRLCEYIYQVSTF